MAEVSNAGKDKKSDTKKKKAIGLISGGLDSTLAVRVVAGLGFEVTALHFNVPFCENTGQCGYIRNRNDLGDDVTLVRLDAGKEYIDMVKDPEHGYGKNMNPCIDCRLFMLKRAKKVMEDTGAEFVFTGEVLQQRPMSQRNDSLKLIDKKSNLEGRLLRPLSAQCLPQTVPEKEGVVDRSKLHNISGRGRKKQMALAEKLGIKEYPSPAGGCLLTDQNYSRKLREAFDHDEDSLEVIHLLTIGRHFRSESGARIVCGRDEAENESLLNLAPDNNPAVTVHGTTGTYAVIWGDASEGNLRLAGQVAARYSKVRDSEVTEVKWWRGKEGEKDGFEVLSVPLLSDKELQKYRI